MYLLTDVQSLTSLFLYWIIFAKGQGATSQIINLFNTQIAGADVRVRIRRSIVHIDVATTFRAIVPIATNKHVGMRS